MNTVISPIIYIISNHLHQIDQHFMWLEDRHLIDSGPLCVDSILTIGRDENFMFTIFLIQVNTCDLDIETPNWKSIYTYKWKFNKNIVGKTKRMRSINYFEIKKDWLLLLFKDKMTKNKWLKSRCYYGDLCGKESRHFVTTSLYYSLNIFFLV